MKITRFLDMALLVLCCFATYFWNTIPCHVFSTAADITISMALGASIGAMIVRVLT